MVLLPSSSSDDVEDPLVVELWAMIMLTLCGLKKICEKGMGIDEVGRKGMYGVK